MKQIPTMFLLTWGGALASADHDRRLFADRGQALAAAETLLREQKAQGHFHPAWEIDGEPKTPRQSIPAILRCLDGRGVWRYDSEYYLRIEALPVEVAPVCADTVALTPEERERLMSGLVDDWLNTVTAARDDRNGREYVAAIARNGWVGYATHTDAELIAAAEVQGLDDLLTDVLPEEV